MSDDPPLSPSQRLALILDMLRKAVAAHAGRHRSFSPIVLILWPYLHRIAARFDSLSRRGFLTRPSRTLANPSAPTTPPAEPKPRRPGLPCGFGWLGRLGPEIRVYGSLLEHLFRDPQMRAILAASPQANRVLRPLCRMLGLQAAPDLPASLFPPRPARPAPPPRAAPRMREKPVRPSRPRCDPAEWWMPKRA